MQKENIQNKSRIRIASAGRRLVAHLIDSGLDLAVTTGLVWKMAAAGTIESLLNSLLVCLGAVFSFALVWMIYVSVMTSKLGGTIGKLLVGIEVADLEGKRISFWRAFFRNIIGYPVSGMALWLGFIWVAVNKERRGWHDMMARTIVVEKNKKGLIAGIFGLIVIIWAIVTMGIKIMGQVKQNLPFYQETVEDIANEIANLQSANNRE